MGTPELVLFSSLLYQEVSCKSIGCKIISTLYVCFRSSVARVVVLYSVRIPTEFVFPSSIISIAEIKIEHSYLLLDPKVNGADIERHNSTHFTVTVSLAYTGGGAISTIILENSNQAPIRIPASPSPDSNLVWTGDFSITDTSLNPADFMVSVLNEHDFNSEARSVVGKVMNRLI